MIIDIAKRKFNTALNLAEHSRYFDALAIFTSYPDDYEAQLNRIGCLSAMGEPIAAVRVLRRLLAKCYFTHNVFADVMSLGEPTEHIVKDTVAKLIGKRNYARDDDKISAERSKLAHYEFVPDDNDGLGLELDFFNDSTLWDAPAYAEDNFYDIKSKVYRDHLRLTMEKSFLEGDDEKFQLYAKRLLALKDADDIETVEAQVVTAYYLNKRTKAVGFIEKLCKFDNVSSRALRVALSVMFDDKNLKCKKVITRLMELAMPVIAEFSPLDLCDMIMFAENVAQNDEYAYKFAKELFPVADTCYGAIDYLRVCACALYNGHDKETARNAVLRIIAGYPRTVLRSAFCSFSTKISTRITARSLTLQASIVARSGCLSRLLFTKSLFVSATWTRNCRISTGRNLPASQGLSGTPKHLQRKATSLNISNSPTCYGTALPSGRWKRTI